MNPKQPLTILTFLLAVIAGCTSTRPTVPKLISNPESNRTYDTPTKLDSLKPLLQVASQQAAAKADSMGRITHPHLFQPLFINPKLKHQQ